MANPVIDESRNRYVAVLIDVPGCPAPVLMPQFLSHPVKNLVGCGHHLGLTLKGQYPPQFTDMELDDFAGGLDFVQPDMHVFGPRSLFGTKDYHSPAANTAAIRAAISAALPAKEAW